MLQVEGNGPMSRNCNSGKSLSNLPGSKIVENLGMYLYKNLDTAYKYTKSSNSFDVYLVAINSEDTENDKVAIDISITTYQDRIRVNCIDLTERERTLGYDAFKLETFNILPEGYQIVLNKVLKRISKFYTI